MISARLISSDEKKDISDITKEDNGNLKCCHCQARINFREAFKRRTKGGEIATVRAYLALNPNAEHREDCPNNLRAEIKRIARQSESIDDLKIITGNFEKGFEFNLNVITEAFQEIAKLEAGCEDSDYSKKSAIEYIQSPRRISSYLRSASDIAKILSKLDDIDELSDKISICFNDKKIKWRDFYYDMSSYHILGNRLAANELSHPISMQMAVEGVKGGEAEGFEVDGAYPKGQSGPFIHYPHLQMYSGKLRDLLKRKREYIVVGRPKLRQYSLGRHLDLQIFHENQIAELDF